MTPPRGDTGVSPVDRSWMCAVMFLKPAAHSGAADVGASQDCEFHPRLPRRRCLHPTPNIQHSTHGTSGGTGVSPVDRSWMRTVVFLKPAAHSGAADARHIPHDDFHPHRPRRRCLRAAPNTPNTQHTQHTQPTGVRGRQVPGAASSGGGEFRGRGWFSVGEDGGFGLVRPGGCPSPGRDCDQARSHQ